MMRQSQSDFSLSRMGNVECCELIRVNSLRIHLLKIVFTIYLDDLANINYSKLFFKAKLLENRN